MTLLFAKKRWKFIVIGASILILAAFSFQYPSVMPAPIGGDAAIHVRRAMDWNVGSVYPLSMTMFAAAARIIPVSWETSFVIWMALGHSMAGIIIGLILYRLKGLTPAVLGMLLWAAATMNVLPFFRAATMPQLWSMVFLLLMLERFSKGAVWWGLLALGATYFAHPLSFAVGALVASLTVPTLLVWRWIPDIFPRRGIAFGGTVISGVIILSVFILFPSLFPYADLVWNEPWHNVLRLLSTHFGPVFFLAPVGVVYIATRRTIALPARLTILVFGVLGIAVSASDMYGGEIPVKRFIPYGIAAVTIFGALGLVHLVHTISPLSWVRYTLISIILAVILGNGWYTAHVAYNSFQEGCDAPYTCAAVRDAEREAYEWIRSNTPEHTVLAVSDGRGRATEWIPVLAERAVVAPRLTGPWVRTFYTESCVDILSAATNRTPPTHVLFYKTGDTIPEPYSNQPELFPIVFENEDVLIHALPNLGDIQEEQQREELCLN